MMDIYSPQQHRDELQRLQKHLLSVEASSGLGAALEQLRVHQVDSGFIRDDLSEVLRFEFPHPACDGDYFAAQYNPARARRFGGSGVNVPPAGFRSVNDGCFLCAENIEWQQHGAEVGYAIPGGRIPYTAWMNPFPLAKGHAIIASDDHIAQHWEASGIALSELASDLIDLADRLPGWITFYNGAGAGASIEGHLHYHALPRTPGLGKLPIELAAERHRVDLARTNNFNGAVARGLYPLDFVHWRGPREALTAPMLNWLATWEGERGGDPDATANAVAVRDANGPEMDVYFIPRVRSRSRTEGFGGVIGAFETMGEIICSQPHERERIDSGAVDYASIADMLAHVSVALYK